VTQKLALIFITPEGSFTEKLDAGSRQRWTLGRSHMTADIPVRHPYISKKHAAITAAPDTATAGGTPQFRWELWDEGSRNGSFINGRRLSLENEKSQKGHRLEEGDKIHLANQLIKVSFDLDETTGIPLLSDVDPDLDTPAAAAAPPIPTVPPPDTASTPIAPKTVWDVVAMNLPWFHQQSLFAQVMLMFTGGLLTALLLWVWRNG